MTRSAGGQRRRSDGAGGRGAHRAAGLGSRAALRAILAGVAATALVVVGATCVCLMFKPVLPLIPAVYWVSEVIFALWWYRRRIRQLEGMPAQPDSSEGINCAPREVFGQVLRELHSRSPEEGAAMLQMWFEGAAYEDLRADNVAEWIGYSFFGCSLETLPVEQRLEVLDMRARLQAALPEGLLAGRNPDVHSMQHLDEPLRRVYRPLAFYASMELLTLLTWVMLAAVGFRRRVVLGTTAYVRARDARQSPVLVLHGLGVGLIAYTGFLFSLMSTGRPIIVVELVHVAQRISTVLTVSEVVMRLVALMAELRVPVVDVVAHSYGTLVASALVKQHPASVSSVTLIDPVCFNMWMPRLLRSLFYTFPNTGSVVADWLMYLATREVHCAAALSRRFSWQAVNFWPELLPQRTLVVLSEADILIDAFRMRNWLESRACVRVLMLDDTAHAGFLLHHSSQLAIVAHVEQMLNAPVQRTCM